MDFTKYTDIYVKKIIFIQKYIRGYLCRLKRLPFILYILQNHLIKYNIKLLNDESDGRINSYINEGYIINILSIKYKTKIFIPPKRYWYDILVYDNIYGWIPVNIKITTMKTADNTGNLTMCVYAYTDENINLLKTNIKYDNGSMSKILIDKLKNGNYNKCNKKDYYFLVINKNNSRDIIINSLKGLSNLTHNINNLPFQIKWKNNKIFIYNRIELKISQFINCIVASKNSWRDNFIYELKKLKI